MILNLMDVDKMVKVNNLQPVTSTLMFDEQGQPNEEGLFSYKIFGIPGSEERKSRPAYIQLDDFYLIPHVYSILVKLNRNIGELISGTSYFVFDEKKKQLVKVNKDVPGMGTGLSFLYKYWEQIKFAESDSKARTDRVRLINDLTKDQAFMDKQFVIPAFYRDMSDGFRVPEIDGMYKKLIAAVDTIIKMGSTGFTYNITRARIQNTINEIYSYFTGILKLKNGFMHKSVMSKNIDYGVRTIITASPFNTNSWRELRANYEKAAVPLTEVLGLFPIFIQANVESWVDRIIGGKTSIDVYNKKTKHLESFDLDPKWKNEFITEGIQKRMELFIHTPETRYDTVTVKCVDNKRVPLILMVDPLKTNVKPEGELNIEMYDNLRPMTWTDLFYIIAYDVTLDKHVLITRYPVSNMYSEYFAGIDVMTTHQTIKNYTFNGVTYQNYPKINLDLNKIYIEREFTDSLMLGTMYTDGLGADYDGDQVSIRGLYTKEANDFAKEKILSLSNISKPGGGTRGSLNVGEHSFFNLLREIEE